MPGVSLPKHGGGREIPDLVRQKMESALDDDFSKVRVHEGPDAASVGAVAYTQGEDIHFAPGQYQLNSQSGQSLLGHELAHVVQQHAGRVQAPDGAGAPINAEISLEAEADRLGASAARHRFEATTEASSPSEATVQPKAQEERLQRQEDELQMKQAPESIQRAELDEEEDL